MASTTEDAVESSSDPTSTPNVHRVRIAYARPGSVPPVYLAGSFTAPPWDPQEMQYTELRSKEAESGETGQQARPEYQFYKDLDVEEGRWQYRFRVGQGDLWVIDENAPTVVGRGGGRNNSLVVREDSTSHALERAPLSETTTTEPETVPSEVPVAQLNPPQPGGEGHLSGEAVGVLESPDLPISVRSDANEPVKPEDLPVKLSEPDIIPPQEEVTVLKERDKAVPQDVEDKTNLVLPGHENRGGELVGVQEKGTAPNGVRRATLNANGNSEVLEVSRGSNGDCQIENIGEQPLELGEQAEQTTKSPLKPSFTEQKGSVPSRDYEVFPIQPVEESIDEFTEVFDSSDEHIKGSSSNKEPASIETPNFIEEIPIPFTVVEKAPDEEPPTYGEDAGRDGSLREGVEDRQADAEPDQSIGPEQPQLNDGVSEGASKPVSIPLLVVDKTDGKPSYGDDFGAKGSHAQKLAHEKRAADAEPDEIHIPPGESIAAEVVAEHNRHPSITKAKEDPKVEESPETMEAPEVGGPAEPKEAPVPGEALVKAEAMDPEKAPEVVETLEPEQTPEFEKSAEAAEALGPEGAIAAGSTEKVETLGVVEAAEQEVSGKTEAREIAEVSEVEEPVVPAKAVKPTEAAEPEGVPDTAEAPETAAVLEIETTAPTEAAKPAETPEAEEIVMIAEAPVAEGAPQPERVSELEEVTAIAEVPEAGSPTPEEVPQPEVESPTPEEVPQPEAVAQTIERETSGTAEVPEAPGVDGTTVAEGQANRVPGESSGLTKTATSPGIKTGIGYGAVETDNPIVQQPDKERDVNVREASEQAGMRCTSNDEELLKDAGHSSENRVLPVSDVGASQAHGEPAVVEVDKAENAVIEAGKDLEASTSSAAAAEVPEVATEVPSETHGPTGTVTLTTPVEHEPAAMNAPKDDSVAPSQSEAGGSGSHVDTSGVRGEFPAANKFEEGTEIPKVGNLYTGRSAAKGGDLAVGPETSDKSPNVEILKEECRTKAHHVGESCEPEVTKGEDLVEVPNSTHGSPEIGMPKEEDSIRAPHISQSPETDVAKGGNPSEALEAAKEPINGDHQGPGATVDPEAVHLKGDVGNEPLSEAKHEGKSGEPAQATSAALVESAPAPAHHDPLAPIPGTDTAVADTSVNTTRLDGPGEVLSRQPLERGLGPDPELGEAKSPSFTPGAPSTAAGTANTAKTDGKDEYTGQPGSSLSKFAAAVGYNHETESPRIEDAPLFAHECLTPCEELPVDPKHQLRNSLVGSDSPPEPEEPSAVDLEDPLLEAFPSDREHIIERLRTTESRLEEDETSVEGIPPSPILSTGSQLSDAPARRSPSPLVERSPNLDAIPEEDAPSSTSQAHVLPEAASAGLESHESQTVPVPATNTPAVLAGATAAVIAGQFKDSSDEGTPQGDRVDSLPSAVPREADPGLAHLAPAASDTKAVQFANAVPDASKAGQDIAVLQTSISPEGEVLPTNAPAESPTSSFERSEVAKPAVEVPAEELDAPSSPISQPQPVPGLADHGVTSDEPSGEPGSPALANAGSAVISTITPASSTAILAAGAGPEQRDPLSGVPEIAKDGQTEAHRPAEVSASPDTAEDKATMESTLEGQVPLESPTHESVVQSDDCAGISSEGPALSATILTDNMQASSDVAPKVVPQAVRDDVHVLDEANAEAEAAKDKASIEGGLKREVPLDQGAPVGAAGDTGDATSAKINTTDTTTKVIAGAVIGTAIIIGGAVSAMEANERDEASDNLHSKTPSTAGKEPDSGPQFVAQGRTAEVSTREQGEAVTETTVIGEVTEEPEHSTAKTSASGVAATGEPTRAENGAAKAKPTGADGEGGDTLEGGLRQRKATTDAGDRPRTPHSIQSTKAPKHSNIFKTFWRTVFGGWIGGFFAKIFSKKQRRA
ncbi:MAG: hypothetical protein M1839_007035 [Geoglossum umbratile]|nr:MAG: hypothetical protein M1839_007035 [Geoglossum umbratile]